MIETTLTVMGSLELACLLYLFARVQAIEKALGDISVTAEAVAIPPIDELMTAVREEILDTISEMRPPTAIDHVAGVWSQIMMMREQVKMAKAGLMPGAAEPEMVAEETL